MTIPSSPQGKWSAIASDQQVAAGDGEVLAVMLSHTSATTLALFDSLTAPAEFVLNPGFETAGAGGADVWGDWIETAGDGALANETTSKHAGSDAAKVTAGPTLDTKVHQVFTVVPDLEYELTFYTRGDVTNDGRYRVVNVGTGEAIIATTDTGVTGATYTLVTARFIAPPLCTSIRLDLMCPGVDAGVAYYDTVSLLLLAFDTIKVNANETVFQDYSKLGGKPFLVGVWADWTAGVARICIDN